jgi:hypothetical protein
MTSNDKPKSFMQQLDAWTEDRVIGPLIDPNIADPGEDREVTIARVKNAIRDKVLESYHNGQRAPVARTAQPKRYAHR